jgi:tetratricopeptide (TPR) repeat protein
MDLDFDEGALGHDEAAFAAERKTLQLLNDGSDADLSDQAKPSGIILEQINESFSLSDFGTVIADTRKLLAIQDYDSTWENARETAIVALALLHNDRASQAEEQTIPPPSNSFYRATRLGAEVAADYWSHDWTSVIARTAAFEAAMKAVGGSPSNLLDIYARQAWPYEATALAMIGQAARAHALIDKTPLDCYTCVRNRADIDAAEKNWRGADYWFARATGAAPSIPMAFWDWGRVLLERGDINGAIAKFALANQKGPHFADPLEGWGEALMAQNRSDLALAKFAEADKYAPNWARLHLKWGEAFFFAGQKDEAKKQFAIARTLDLLPAEKTELAQLDGIPLERSRGRR